MVAAMTMTKARSGERAFWRCPVSVAVVARPDEQLCFDGDRRDVSLTSRFCDNAEVRRKRGTDGAN